MARQAESRRPSAKAAPAWAKNTSIANRSMTPPAKMQKAYIKYGFILEKILHGGRGPFQARAGV
jgi:hypothetical protein